MEVKIYRGVAFEVNPLYFINILKGNCMLREILSNFLEELGKQIVWVCYEPTEHIYVPIFSGGRKEERWAVGCIGSMGTGTLFYSTPFSQHIQRGWYIVGTPKCVFIKCKNSGLYPEASPHPICTVER